MTDRGAIESIAEDVLAFHWRRGSGLTHNSPDVCACGARTLPEKGDEDVSERRARAFAKHQTERILDRLTAYGWAVVRTGGWQHSITEPLEPDRLPRPMSLDLCRRRIATRRALVERDGADPSSMPILLRRPLLVQFPWEPVPEGSEDAQ